MLVLISEQVQLWQSQGKYQAGYGCGPKHPQRGSPVLSCHVWFIPFLMMLWLLMLTSVLFIATYNTSFDMSWHYGMLLSLLSPSCLFFWWLGEAVRHKHVKSQHCDSSNCPQCLHCGTVKGCVKKRVGISRLSDLAVCMGIVLISFKMTAKLTSYLFILQLLLQAGDVETNPGPPFDLVSDNLVKVLDLVLDVASKWYELGLQLGVKESDLKAIEHDYGDRGVKRCLSEMLSVWLKMIDPRPSWEALLLSVSHSTVENPTLAREIRQKLQMQSEGVQGSATPPSKRSKLTVAFEATRFLLEGLFMGIKDPDVIACAMLSVNIISDETVMDIASVATMQEKDAQLVRSQLFEAMAKELKDQGAGDELRAGMMDTAASLDLSLVTKNTKLKQAVMNKLETEPERFTDVMNVLESNSSDSTKRRVQILKKRHVDLLCQLTAEESKENSAGGATLTTPAVSTYASYLRRLYGEFVFISDEWPPMVIDRYVNLALIKHQAIPKASEIDSFMKSTLHGTVDDIHLEKQTIRLEHILKSQYFMDRESKKVRKKLLDESLNQMFDAPVKQERRVDHTQKLLGQVNMQLSLSNSILFGNLAPTEGEAKDVKGQRVLLDGAPGVGKTTLCHNACKEWADDKAFTDFKLMVYIPLREREVANASEIEHLFCYGPKSLRRAAAEELDDTDGEDVLLVFDGWDELSLKQRGKESLLCKIIQRKTLLRCTILITSRPYASNWLRNPKICNRHIEIFGFTDRQVNQCIQNVLHPEPAKALLQQLEIRSDVKALCYVPMNLAMILYIFQALGKLPNTLTGIYDSFTNNALLRYLQDYDSSTEPITLLANRNALPSEVKQLFDALCQVAYDGLMKDQMVFTKEELKKYHPQLTASSNTLGLLTAFKGFTESGIDLHYQFLHLTIQEFLSAEALVQKPADIQTKFAFEHLNDGRFRTMIRFIFGKAQLDDIEHLFNFLYATISSVADESRFLFLCHMLYEAGSTEAIKNVGKNLSPCVTNLPFSTDVKFFDAMVMGRFLSFICAPIKSLNMRDSNFSAEEFKLFTDSLSQDCAKVLIEELYFEMRYCHSHEIAPLILHPVFHSTTYLEIDVCNAPEIAIKTCSAIAKMPGLTGLHVHFRPPFSVDKTIDKEKVIIIEPQENPAVAIENLFEALAHNPKVTFLKVTEFMNKKSGLELLGEKSSTALINMIETRDATISFHFRLRLFSRSFIEHFSKYLSKSKKIEELCFDEYVCPQDKRMTASESTSLFNALKSNNFLHSFQLLNVKLMFETTDSDHTQALEDMLLTNTSLKMLKIKKCPLPSLDITAISKGLMVNKTLTELFLDGITDEPGPIVDALACNSTLSTLQLRDCNLEDKHESSISTMLRNGSIKSLDLSSNKLESTGAIGLFTALQSDSVKLEELSLHSNNLHDSGELATVVESALSCNQMLKVLKLDGCSLHSSVVEGIATSLASNSILESISLRKNNITVSGVWQLCTILQVNAGLQSLKLRDSIILDRATIDQLIEVLKFNSTLNTLELEFEACFYDEVSFQMFIDTLKMNSTLTRLKMTGLENSHLDSINFDRLKQNIPVLLVRDYSSGRS